jgi:hypothetical protein
MALCGTPTDDDDDERVVTQLHICVANLWAVPSYAVIAQVLVVMHPY